MNLASKALQAEDQFLKKHIQKNRAKKSRAFNVGPGLSYWVYETTLVYLIWRAWIGKGIAAAWDWTLADLTAHKTKDKEHGGLRYDLVVFGKNNEPTMVFEAKWWNDDKQKVAQSIEDDAIKLKDSTFFGECRKFILLFWHEEKSKTAQYAKTAEDQLKDYGSIIGYARFKAKFRKKQKDVDGNFVLALCELK